MRICGCGRCTSTAGRWRRRPRRSAKCFFLLGHTLTQSLLFCGAEDDGVWTEPLQPADHADILRIWARWLQTRLGQRLPVAGDWSLAAVLAYPGARLRVARDREGRAVGFSGILPLCQEMLPLLAQDRSLASLLRTRWTAPKRAAWPRTAAESRAFVLRFLAETGPSAPAVRAALLRAMGGVLAGSGTYFVATPIPEYKALLEVLGFRPLPDGHDAGHGGGQPTEAFELDLSQVGFTAWIEGLILGRPAPRALDPREVERHLQTVLVHWHDDAWLEAAPRPCLGVHAAGAAALRGAVRRALHRARAQVEDDAVYRALELAYLTPDLLAPAEAAAQLGVSRATFYRLVRRGVRALATACVDTGRRRPERGW